MMKSNKEALLECSNCGEPAHVYFCTKPDNISKEAWAEMADDQRYEITHPKVDK